MEGYFLGECRRASKNVMRAVNLTTGEEIAYNVTVARGLFARMKGLLGQKMMAEGEALLIDPCKGIHTFGMRFRIDVIFFDRRNRVVALWKSLTPNRITPFYFRAATALELPSGTLDKIRVRMGDEVGLV